MQESATRLRSANCRQFHATPRSQTLREYDERGLRFAHAADLLDVRAGANDDRGHADAHGHARSTPCARPICQCQKAARRPIAHPSLKANQAANFLAAKAITGLLRLPLRNGQNPTVRPHSMLSLAFGAPRGRVSAGGLGPPIQKTTLRT